MPNSSEDLINLLKEKRKELKTSQNKLAKKIDVAHTSVARIEKGTINPNVINLSKNFRKKILAFLFI